MSNYKSEEQLAQEFILENELTSEEALDLAVAVGGYNMETLNYVIYRFTSYHDIEQLWECEQDSFYFNDDIKDYYGLCENEDEEDE